MPLYVYHCPVCALTEEQVHGIGRDPSPCPSCGATMNRMPTAPKLKLVSDGQNGWRDNGQGLLSRTFGD